MSSHGFNIDTELSEEETWLLEEELERDFGSFFTPCYDKEGGASCVGQLIFKGNGVLMQAVNEADVDRVRAKLRDNSGMSVSELFADLPSHGSSGLAGDHDLLDLFGSQSAHALYEAQAVTGGGARQDYIDTDSVYSIIRRVAAAVEAELAVLYGDTFCLGLQGLGGAEGNRIALHSALPAALRALFAGYERDHT
jgi:hypothetical protein